MRRKLGLWLQAAALLLGFFGAAMTWMSAPGLWKGPATTFWPKAPAVVTKCETEVVTTSRGNNTRIHFEYEYQVDGQKYRCDRVSYGVSGVRAIDRWQKGQPIEISYDPKDPAQAVVIPGRSQATVRWFFAGLGVLAAAGLMFWLGGRMDRP